MNARTFFRYFKSFIDYKLIKNILAQADSMPLHKLILALIPRVAFFIFWFFDHLVVLGKIKFSKRINLKWVLHKWGFLWMVANTTNIIASIVTLRELKREKKAIIDKKKFEYLKSSASHYREKE